MGLSVCVGVLAEMDDEEGAEWLREQMATANSVLAAHGLPPHEEPQTPVEASRAALDGFPYSWIHTLRRAYAHCVMRPGKPLRLLRPDEDGADDPDVDRLAHELTSHLITHSDAEGLYLPIDFARVIVDESLTGGMLGSTPRLMRELVQVAPVLGIKLHGQELSDAEADIINGELESQPPLWRERAAWLQLYEAARLSLEHRAAIVFQ